MSGRKSEPDTTNTPGSQETEAAPQCLPAQDTSLRRGLPFHPLLIAAFPILSLYAHNIDEVPLHDVWRPLGLALLGTLGAWALTGLLTRHIRKSALAASVVILVFFSYGHISNLLPEDLRGLLPACCIAGLLVLLTTLCKSRGRFVSTTLFLNFASAALLIPSCFVIGSRLIARTTQTASSVSRQGELVSAKSGSKQGGLDPALITSSSSAAPVAEAKNLPDVYYIILDAYGRSDSLKTFYGYDNTPFLQALEQRGFYIARHSRANYAQTGYCLPTSLNMNYLDSLLQPYASGENLFESLRQKIDENEVAADLRRFGYHYVTIWTGSSISRADTADLMLYDDKLPSPSSFEGQVFSLSALEAVPQTPQEKIPYADQYERHRAFILTAFHNLDSVAKLPYPKFVFAHILAPHPPFVFGPQGEAINPRYPYSENDGSQLLQMRRFSREQYKSGYTAQLQYINGRVLKAVDAILRQSKQPPIIIIQGDHGSRMNVDWNSQAKTDLREPFSILNAYFVPSRMKSHLYDTITPVNSFRLMLTDVFGLNYPLLPDRSFFSTPDHPLHFAEVTHLLPEFSEMASPQPPANSESR